MHRTTLYRRKIGSFRILRAVIVIVSAVFIVLNIKQISLMCSDYNKLYKNEMNGLDIEADMFTYFRDIQNDINSQLKNYNGVLQINIDTNISKFNESLTEFSSDSVIQEDFKEKTDELHTNFNQYINCWNNLKANLENNEKISKQDEAKIDIYRKQAADSLGRAVNTKKDLNKKELYDFEKLINNFKKLNIIMAAFIGILFIIYILTFLKKNIFLKKGRKNKAVMYRI